MSNGQIVKTSGPDRDGESRGHCYDGTGWILCDFWYHEGGESQCQLFWGVRKDASLALIACDKLYGVNYVGRP